MFGFCVGDVKGCAKCGALGINSFEVFLSLASGYFLTSDQYSWEYLRKTLYRLQVSL